jgi:hypothetical protein
MQFPALVALLFGGALALSSAAKADTYDWTLTGTIDGSGTITTSNTPPATNAGSVGQNVTGVTGTIDGETIGILNSFGDNILYPSNVGTDGFGPLKGALDALGLSFDVNGNVTANIFFAGNGYDVEIFPTTGEVFAGGESFSVVAATPLPPAWTMMLGAIVMLGFYAFRTTKGRSFQPTFA